MNESEFREKIKQRSSIIEKYLPFEDNRPLTEDTLKELGFEWDEPIKLAAYRVNGTTLVVRNNKVSVLGSFTKK